MENPLRRRLCLSDDKAIGAVGGECSGANCFLLSCFPEKILRMITYERRNRDCSLSTEAWKENQVVELLRDAALRLPPFRKPAWHSPRKRG